MQATKWRFTFLAFLTVLALWGIGPSLVYFSQPKEVRNDQKVLAEKIPNWMPDSHVKLGLDLQGGVQLVLGVSTAEAVDTKLARDSVEITRWAEGKGYKVKPAYLVRERQVLRVELEEGVDAAKFADEVKKEFFGLVAAGSEGRNLEFKYDEEQVKQVKASAIEQAERVIRSRVDKWGVTEPLINRRADNSILVQLPGFRDPQKAKELLGRTAQLKFKLVAEDFTAFDSLTNQLPAGVTTERSGQQTHFLSENQEQLTTLLKPLVPENLELLFEREEIAGNKNKARYRSYVVQASTAMTGEDILDAFVQQGGDIDPFPEVGLKFTGPGSKRMGDVSGENINKRLAIILDNVIFSAPVLKTKITGAASITLGSGRGYNEALEEAQALSLILKSGALPATITVLEERQVGASLGPELANQGVKGVLLGLGLVLAFMVFYYRRPGVIACIALVLNGIFLLALMAVFGFALTLPGIAGFILTLGMAVDANVLINERIRQELQSGKNAKKAVEVAYNKVFWTVFDANVTTLIAALVLLETNSSGPIRGFAVTLMIGLLVSMFTSLAVTKWLFDLALSRAKSDAAIRTWLGETSNSHVFNFNFLRLGKTITAACIVLSVFIVGLAGVRGVNWGVDFAGGTELMLGFGENVEPGEIREVAEQAGIDSMSVQALEGGKKQYLLRFDRAGANNANGKDSKVEQEQSNVKDALNVQKLQTLVLEKFEKSRPEILQVDFVGPQVGKELRNQGVASVFIAIFFILLYIAVRFDIRYGPGAVAKMFLDVFLLMGMYVFFWRSFDLTTVAAFLTVVGYSVNDTIVIFDRIRENTAIQGRRSYAEIVNLSLNEVLARSINTSISTFLSLVGILIFGTGQIWDFAMAMALGVCLATLSTTFIAPVILVWFTEYQQKRSAQKAAFGGVSSTKALGAHK
ncbi:MAG: protein translocase subunit SecD [Oligoflexales bacterium]|nr:protein translocase subunit SecD [Oligoflexales bacterium]